MVTINIRKKLEAHFREIHKGKNRKLNNKLQFAKEVFNYRFNILPAQIKLINGMMKFEDVTSDGWQEAREIMERGDIHWQINNFSNYVKPFIKGCMVETDMFTYTDEKGREVSKRKYRLIPTLFVFTLLSGLNKIGKMKGYESIKIYGKSFAQLLERSEGLSAITAFNKTQKLSDYSILWGKQELLQQEMDDVHSEIKRMDKDKDLKPKQEVNKK